MRYTEEKREKRDWRREKRKPGGAALSSKCLSI